MAQHNSSTPIEARDSWRTPPWLFRWLDERFHDEAGKKGMHEQP